MAARRLGCSLLQRAQAAATSPAVAEGRRRIVSERRIHTEQHPNHVAAPRFFEEYPRSQILQKKEELYNLISDADKQFPGGGGNRQLLQHLSLHVAPRPHDPEWRRLTTTIKVAKWIYWSGLTSWVLAVWFLCPGDVAVAQKKNVA